MTGNTIGDVQVSIPPNAAVDVVENPNNASTSTDNIVHFDNVLPIVLPVHIASNNANTAFAKVGDVVTLTFTVDEPCNAASLTIAGHNVTLTPNSLNYTGSYTMSNSDIDGLITFSISVTDMSGNIKTQTATTDNSSVTFDKTKPAVVLSDDHADGIVLNADNVIITATFTEENGIFETVPPTISIGTLITNAPMTKTTNLVWTYAWDVPANNDGNVNVSIVATDIAGNSNDATAGQNSYIIDNTQPTVVLTDNHPDEIVLNADNVTITATFTETNGIEETIQPKITIGTLIVAQNMNKISNSIWTYDWNVPANNADVSVTITATDVAGNSNATATGNILYTIDNTQPTVDVTNNDNDNIVCDADNVTITATFTEANGIFETTPPKITIGSLVTAQNMTRTSNTVWTYVWNVPAGNDGIVNVSIVAFDVAGNQNIAATGATSFTIDNTGPTVALTCDHNDNVVRDADNVTFSFVKTLNTSTPTITIGTLVTEVEMASTSQNWTYTWNVPAGNDGNISVSIKIFDQDDNQNVTTTGSTSFLIDNTQPTVVLTDDHEDNQVLDADEVQITATFTENDAIVSSPTITIENLVLNVPMTSTADNKIWTYTWNVPDGTNAEVAVSIAATDRAGNENTPATAGTNGTLSYIIDNVSPAVQFDGSEVETSDATISIDSKLIVTANEELRKKSTSEIGNVDLSNYLTVKYTTGDNIDFSAEISPDKKTITITPISNLLCSDTIRVEFNNNSEAADHAGNLVTNSSKTFYTNKKPDIPVIAQQSSSSQIAKLCPGDTVFCSNLYNTANAVYHNQSISYSWKLNNEATDITTKFIIAERGDSGTYKVTVNNSVTGCSNFANKQVDIHRIATPDLKLKTRANATVKVIICKNIKDSLKTFQWYNGTTKLDGQTNPFYVINSGGGDFYAMVSDINSCKIESDHEKISATLRTMYVYPSVAQNDFNVEFADEDNGMVSLNVINTSGLSVYRAEYNKNDLYFKTSVRLPKLPNGIYLVQVRLGSNAQYVEKLIIQH